MFGRTTAEATIIVQKIDGPPKLEFEPYDDEVLPGTVIEIPCKAQGEANYKVNIIFGR